MTSFVLKIIALITMFIDHLGYSIYGKFSYLNYIGRIAFPIFAFQISEGFVHTKNIKKYFIRLLVFAIISQFPFMLFLSTFSKNIYELNIFFTLSFGLLAIFIFDKIINTNLTIFNKSIDKFIKLFLGLLITFFIGVIAELLNFDYGLFGIAIIFMFYLFKNDKVAMCFNGVQVEGTAKNLGLVVDEPGRIFEKKYKEFLWQSYNAYSHIDTEILIEVTPKFVEIWDEDENRNAFQLFIDFDKETVEYKPYD